MTGVWVGFDQPQTIISNGYAGDLAVPIWAQFMKAATKGDKPDWFDRPSNVVGVNVCRMSGKLPNAGCEHVQVVNGDGCIETRSMIYTEYFVKGTQPTDDLPAAPARRLADGSPASALRHADPPELPGAPAAADRRATGATAPRPSADPATGGTVEDRQPKKRGILVAGLRRRKQGRARRTEEGEARTRSRMAADEVIRSAVAVMPFGRSRAIAHVLDFWRAPSRAARCRPA